MKKLISLFLLLFFIFSFQNDIFAAQIDVNNLEKAVIKVSETDGTIKEITINNDNNGQGQFEQVIKSWMDYYYNKYNIKEILSINDIPLKDTQFVNYAGTHKNVNKQSPVEQNAKNNENQSLDFSNSGFRMSIDNVTYTDINVSPYNKNGVTYIEIKPVLEALDYKVTTVINNYYKILSAQKNDSGNDYCIDVIGDSKNAYSLGTGLINLEDYSEVKNSSICISARSAEKLLGVTIKVDFTSKQVKITSK
ncbi:stalk domain-containing protein [Ruminiclostridium cellobioparum]|uniref:stalk domain-containing protein n=1 Tax=Ruminiclostridium cellobioparum TaxID=29355 RepID=UPI0028A64201|nr:hypothetical protein [Ruminiclostridium cellobioparum]